MKAILILFSFALLIGCQQTNSQNGATIVLEVTTFKLNTTANPAVFNELDATIEATFTSKQPGYIHRQSGVTEQGDYLVLVYWKSVESAQASMQKFMGDESVADYAGMIDPSTMQMARYSVGDGFDNENTSFVEVMSFNPSAEIDLKHFSKTNKKVETDFTSKQQGFLQRLTGIAEDNTQLVVVYWDTKINSDAALQPFMNSEIANEFMGMIDQESIQMGRYQFLSALEAATEISHKDKVVALLNSFNTGDQTPISYINPEKYIQHNLAVGDGLAAFGEVMQHAPPQGFKANVLRAFQDGDYVFTHTAYDFFGPKAAFDVFRFEDGLIVEHWDNLIEMQPANPSGRTQFDGATELTDHDKTEINKKTVEDFIETILLRGEMDKVTTFINPEKYLQHNPAVADGLEGFGEAMRYFAENGLVMEYTKLHKVLGQGNFVLAMSEGKFGKGEHTAFYDLFRLEDGLIVEHWDVIESIPAPSEWKNQNGKF